MMKDKQDIDIALVEQCQADLPYITVSYETLLRRYEGLIYRFCLAYLRSAQDAEEVTQDVFLRVFHHIKGFEGRSHFKTWLMQITRNQCSRRYQKLKRRATFESTDDTNKLIDKSTHESQTNGFDSNDNSPVEQAMNALSDDDKEILTMRHVAGMNVMEVAGILGISESAVKMRHLRAASRFKEKYAALGGKV